MTWVMRSEVQELICYIASTCAFPSPINPIQALSSVAIQSMRKRSRRTFVSTSSGVSSICGLAFSWWMTGGEANCVYWKRACLVAGEWNLP